MQAYCGYSEDLIDCVLLREKCNGNPLMEHSKSLRLPSVVIFICLMGGTGLGQSIDITVPLWFTDTESTGWNPDTLFFGVNAAATYCLDDSLGEFSFVNECGGSVHFECSQFLNPHIGGDSCLIFPVWTDLRASTTSVQIDTFRVVFSGRYPVVVHWSSNMKSYPIRSILRQRLNMTCLC
jgi:hypothetical protein